MTEKKKGIEKGHVMPTLEERQRRLEVKLNSLKEQSFTRSLVPKWKQIKAGEGTFIDKVTALVDFIEDSTGMEIWGVIVESEEDTETETDSTE